MPPYRLTHNAELTTLIHKIIVCIVACAHELRYHHIKVFQGVGTALLNSGILSRLNTTGSRSQLESKFTIELPARFSRGGNSQSIVN